MLNFHGHQAGASNGIPSKIYLEDADSKGIRAKLDNGVLNITVPRQERAAKAERIEIE